jgi:broad specificity phosphatase PhoE
MTVVVALAATAVLAGCGTAEAPVGPTTGKITVVAPPAVVPQDAAQPDSAAPDRVMIIRHAEKPDGTAPGVDADGNEDDSSLTAVGWERAHALVGLFDPAEGDPPAGLARPQTIYAAGVTDEGEGQRTRETVDPLADALGLPVNTEYGKGEEKKLMKDVLELSGTTLISWQHSEIPAIADAFDSVTPAPPEEWPSDRFDVVWTFTRTSDGWAFTQTPELLLPQDHNGVIES